MRPATCTTPPCEPPLVSKETLNTHLAHIVQGWEVKMLSAVVGQHAHQIMLLEHDGWTAYEPLGSVESIERLIREKTGFRVRIEAKRIDLPNVLRMELFPISPAPSAAYANTSVLQSRVVSVCASCCSPTCLIST